MRSGRLLLASVLVTLLTRPAIAGACDVGIRSASLRIDEPGPPRRPHVRHASPVDDDRRLRLHLVTGPADLSSLGLAGGGSVSSVAFDGRLSAGWSWIVRAESGAFEDLRFEGARTMIVREGRVDAARRAGIEALDVGARLGGRGVSHTWVEAGAGVAHTRLEGVVVESVPPVWWRVEDRAAFQGIAAVEIGHRWHFGRVPFELVSELATGARIGHLGGRQVSLRLGLIGVNPFGSR